MRPRAWVIGLTLIGCGFATAVTFQATVAGKTDKLGNAAFLFIAVLFFAPGFALTGASIRRLGRDQRRTGWVAWLLGVVLGLFALCGIAPS